jgi:hypothetical protein
LLERLSQTQFVAVVGASGDGKSSLIRAGLFSTLKQKHARLGVRWLTTSMRPAGTPMWSLAQALCDLARQSSGKIEEEASVTEIEFYRAALARGPRAIAAILREQKQATDHNQLLLVDQFEELFRYNAIGGEAEVSTFLDQLADLIEEPPEGFYLALTMRSDFMGDCARYPRFADALNRASYLLRRMRSGELREAIARPIELFGGAVEPALLDRLISDARGEPDHLPLLQHALMWLWTREAPAAGEAGVFNSPILGLEDYQAAGGLTGALSQHANTIYDRLGGADGSPERRGTLQLACKRIFQALAETGDDGRITRRPCRFAQLAAEVDLPADAVSEVIDSFRSPDHSFLMPPASIPIGEATVIDVSHEAIIRRWDKLSGPKGWLAEEQNDADVWGRMFARTRAFIDNPRRLLPVDETAEFQDFWRRRRPSAAWMHRYSTDHEPLDTRVSLTAPASR